MRDTGAEGMTDAGRLDWLRLIRSRRVGPVTFHRLIADHGSAADALRALPEIASAAGVERYSVCPAGVAQAEMSLGRAAGARMICHCDSAYPDALRDLPDAPPVLWVLGDAGLLNRPAIAMVGARNASSLGLRMARRLAETLGSAGYVTVSGLARGIDAESHAASLATGTVAVLAGGVDVTYPAENEGLAREIAAKGCLVSEQPMGMEPQARHFPLRNRIVSGLARAVVVVEAAARSGSLITARTALDQGRDVLAVPGHPFDARASGCNMLLRDGAILVRGAADVIEAVGAAPPDVAHPDVAHPDVAHPDVAHPDVAHPDVALAESAGQTVGEARLRLVPPHGTEGGTGIASPGTGSKGPVAPVPASVGTTARASIAPVPSVASGHGPHTQPGSRAAVPAGGPALRTFQETSALHGLILARLGPSPLAEDQLIRDLALPASALATELLTLELDGQILRQAGGLLSRAT